MIDPTTNLCKENQNDDFRFHVCLATPLDHRMHTVRKWCSWMMAMKNLWTALSDNNASMLNVYGNEIIAIKCADQLEGMLAVEAIPLITR